MSNEEIIGELINFFAVAVLFLIGIAVIFRLFCRKFKFDKKNVELYGLLLNLDTPSLISIAAVTINYLFLVWCMISFQGINIIYIAVTLILVLLSEAVIDHFKDLFLSGALAIINCGAIQVIYLLYRYITEESFNYLLLLLLGLVILFVFLYFTYNLLRSINNVVVRGKYLKEKKYKV